MLTGRRPEKAARLIQRLHLDAPTFEEAHLDVPLPALRQIELGASFAMVLAAWAMDRHAPGAATSKTIARIDMGSAVVRWRRAGVCAVFPAVVDICARPSNQVETIRIVGVGLSVTVVVQAIAELVGSGIQEAVPIVAVGAAAVAEERVDVGIAVAVLVGVVEA